MHFLYKCIHSSLEIHCRVRLCLSEKLNCNTLRAFQAFIVNGHYKNNLTDNANGVTFITCKHMSHTGPIFGGWLPKETLG